VWHGVTGDQLIGPYIFPQHLTTLCKMNCQQSYRMFLYKHDYRCTTSMTERRLISVRSSGSVWIINSQTDWSWRYTELATTVTGSEPITLPCVGLHESYGVCTRGELQGILSAAVLSKVTSSLVTRVRKCIQADGGHNLL
jgi:hypothetical protein